MRLRFRIIFWTGILFLLFVSFLAGWSLLELKAGLKMRTEVFGVQEKLDEILENLQEADNSFLIYKINNGRAEYESFISLMEKTKKQVDAVAKMSGPAEAVRNEVQDLRAILEQKVEIVRDSDVQDTVTVRDDLLITKQIRERIYVIDEILDNNLEKNQMFIGKYFGLNVALLAVSMGTAFLFFFLFSFFVNAEIRRREKLEVDLRQAQDAAINASNLKSQFLATVSHEIRTPLNGIIGMSDLIRERSLRPEMKRFAEILHASSRSLLRIVNDLLDLSKIEANKIDLEMQEVHPDQLIESAIELFGKKAQDKGLRLIGHYDPQLRIVIAADGSRISQILYNLVSNAVKFTEQGTIAVRGRLIGHGHKTMLRLEVQDSGAGIPADQAKNLFQPFLQLENDRSKEGTGLGLAISKKLVEMMNGEIGFDSSDKGSHFWFHIPAKILKPERDTFFEKTEGRFVGWQLPSEISAFVREFADSIGMPFHELTSEAEFAQIQPADRLFVLESPAKLPIHQGQSIVLQGWLSPERILRALRHPGSSEAMSLNTEMDDRTPGMHGLLLLVDDNETNQILAQTQLEGLGYRVHVAGNGVECLEALKQTKYDLILMDCRMPIMDGFETTRRIRESELSLRLGRIPIIAMTANAVEGDRNKCLAAGMDDYISKPFELARLDQLIQAWTKLRAWEIDWSVVHALAAKTNASVVQRLIQSMIRTLTTSIEQMEQKLAQNQPQAVGDIAHHLKSSSAALGAMDFSRLCGQLEEKVGRHESLTLEELEEFRRRAHGFVTELQQQKVY